MEPSFFPFCVVFSTFLGLLVLLALSCSEVSWLNPLFWLSELPYFIYMVAFVEKPGNGRNYATKEEGKIRETLPTMPQKKKKKSGKRRNHATKEGGKIRKIPQPCHKRKRKNQGNPPSHATKEEGEIRKMSQPCHTRRRENQGNANLWHISRCRGFGPISGYIFLQNYDQATSTQTIFVTQTSHLESILGPLMPRSLLFATNLHWETPFQVASIL